MRTYAKRVVGILLATLTIGAAATARAAEPAALPASAAASALPAAPDPWDDPEFQRRFLGSYGFQAEIEPRVTAAEREQLEKILPLLADDSSAAAAELAKVTRPESSAVFDFVLGNVYFQLGKLDEAEQQYRTAVTKFPSFRRAHKNLGLIRARQGRHAEALESLGRVIELGGGDGLVYGLLGFAYAARGRHVSAESAYREALMLQPDELDWKLGLTRSVVKQGKYSEAVALCEGLLAEHPESAELWLIQANAYIGLAQPLRAAENFELVRRMGKASAPSLYTLGDVYVNEGLWRLATGAYAEAVALDPTRDPERPLRSVEILAQRGALDEAAVLLERVRAALGDRLEAGRQRELLKLEARIAVAEGHGDRAAGVLEDVVALDPLDGEALLLLGQHYARHEDPERALFYFERADGIEGFEAEAKIRRAQVLVEQARYGDALPLLRRAQELQPRDPVARYLEQVERLARSTR